MQAFKEDLQMSHNEPAFPTVLHVTGPSAWNSLPSYLKDEMLSLATFKRSLKTYLFATY